MKNSIADYSSSDAWRVILLLSLGFWGSITILAIALLKGGFPWIA